MKKYLFLFALVFFSVSISVSASGTHLLGAFSYNSTAGVGVDVFTGSPFVKGYYVEGSEVVDPMVNEGSVQAYFHITEFDGEGFELALSDMYSAGNADVRMVDGEYEITMGCVDESQNTNEADYFAHMDGYVYWYLLTSRIDVQQEIELFLNPYPNNFEDIQGPCRTFTPEFMLGDTRDVSAYGEFEVEGYLLKGQDDKAYVIVTKYLDQTGLESALQKGIDDGGSINGVLPDGNQKIQIGCYGDFSTGTSWFDIYGDDFFWLASSSKANVVKMKLTAGALPIDGSHCDSDLNTVEVLDVPVEAIGSFSDVTNFHFNYKAIEYLNGQGVIGGYPDGTFGPGLSINRAELMKMVVESKIGDPAKIGDDLSNCFLDVKEDWYAKYVCYGQKQGWIDGYPNGNFEPASNTNRAEAMKIILNAVYDGSLPALSAGELSSVHMPIDAYATEYYYPFLKYAVAKDLVDLQHVVYFADNTYNYELPKNISRQEVAEMLYRLK